MALNFYELKSRWENCSASTNISTLKNGSENSSILNKGSSSSLQHDLPIDTAYTSRLLLSEGLENRPTEPRRQENVAESSIVQRSLKKMESTPQAIWEFKNGFEGSRIAENESPVVSRVDSPDTGATVDVSHESDREEVELVLSDSDEMHESNYDLTMENDLSAEFSEQKTSFRPENRVSEFYNSFSEHLRELESSLRFDSPEKWLFASMEKGNSGTFEASFEGLSSCQSEEEVEKSEFVLRYESDSSNDTEEPSNMGKTLLPNDNFLSELNKQSAVSLIGSECLDKKLNFAKRTSCKEDVEDKVDDNFLDNESFDLPFDGFSRNLLARLLPKEPCRRSSSSCNPKLSRSIKKSTQFQVTSTVLVTDRISDGKFTSTHHRTSSLVVPLSSLEASRIRDSSWMIDSPQLTTSSRMTETTHVTCASKMSNMSQITGLSLATDSTQMTDLAWMTAIGKITDPLQMMDNMGGKVQTESTDEVQKQSKMTVRRGKVILEILDTEVTYQNHLALVIKVNHVLVFIVQFHSSYCEQGSESGWT